MKRLLLVVVAVVGVLALPGTAAAHYPVVSGSAVCNDDGTWNVTWTVRPDLNRPAETWEITSPSGYSPSGSQNAALAFTRTVTYSGSVRTVTEFVAALWSSGFAGAGSAKVSLPDNCLPTTTSTTSTTSTTTSTVPDTTTTTTLPDSTTSTTSSSTSTTSTSTTSTVPDSSTTSSSTTSSLPGTTTTTEPPEEIPVPSPPTTTPSGTTTTTEPGGGTTTTTEPPNEIPIATPPEPGGSPEDIPELPQTGNSGANDVLSLALLLLTVGAYTLIGLRGHRRPLQPE